MPRISYFRGMPIYMYWDEGSHAAPHVHAHHGGTRASVDLDGRVVAGDIDNTALLVCPGVAVTHRDELLANWERARQAEPILPIDPLA